MIKITHKEKIFIVLFSTIICLSIAIGAILLFDSSLVQKNLDTIYFLLLTFGIFGLIPIIPFYLEKGTTMVLVVFLSLLFYVPYVVYSKFKKKK